MDDGRFVQLAMDGLRHQAAVGDLSAPRMAARSVPGAGEIHLWLCHYESIASGELLQRYRALMTTKETARHDRLIFDRHRKQFLVTRALVRTTLSRYGDVAPADWRFDKGQWGKPSVGTSHQLPNLHFNLSNTGGLVAIAVSGSHEALGIDVEDCQRKSDPVGIADRFFSPFEVAALGRLPESQRRSRFFCYWTLKEAYIKARAMGLALPLDGFSYELDKASDRVGIHFAASISDQPEDWSFALLRASPRHLLSVAAKHPNAGPPRLFARVTVPLVD